jgi:pimeloyl-ACP methyl ester carboxylesterase
VKKALVIPGLGGAPDCWAPLFLEKLAERYSVRTTALPEKGGTIAEFATELMPEEPVDLLIGFSVGSAVVQEMLTLNPVAASHAVLMAPPAGNGFQQPPKEAYSFSSGRAKWSLSMLNMMFTPDWLALHSDVSEFFPRIRNPVPEELLIRQSNAIKKWEGCLDKLRNVALPVLILAGRYDIITPLLHSEILSQTLSNACLSVFDTGHGFPWQCPLETADRIMEFSR